MASCFRVVLISIPTNLVTWSRQMMITVMGDATNDDDNDAMSKVTTSKVGAGCRHFDVTPRGGMMERLVSCETFAVRFEA